jgi:hypothetical protein
VNAAKSAYAKRMAEDGAGELARLYAAAAFWDGAYKLATIARDLPSNIAGAVGGGVADFIGTFLPESLKAYSKFVALLLGLLVIATAVLWYKGAVRGVIIAAAGVLCMGAAAIVRDHGEALAELKTSDAVRAVRDERILSDLAAIKAKLGIVP